jgi:HEAT repeat protein
MKQSLIVGGLLLGVGLAVLVVVLVLDPFGLFVPKINFQPSRPPSAEVLALIDKVKSGSDDSRLDAMKQLAGHGPDAEAAVPVLLNLLRSGNEDFRINATLTLGKIGKNAAAPLCQLMKDRDADVRYYSVWALGLIGPDARDRTADVVGLLANSSEKEDVRRKAAETLGRIAGQADQAVPALVKALADPNADVSQAAGTALTQLGAEAVPALLRAVTESDARVQLAAIRALGEVGAGNPQVVAALKDVLLAGDATLAPAAAEALGKQGAAAVPALAEGLGSSQANVRSAAVHGLAAVGAAAVPALLDGLKSKHTDVRSAAAGTFSTLGVIDRQILLGLIDALGDADQQVRSQAVAALYTLSMSGTAGPDFAAVMPALGRALTDNPDPQVRGTIANSLFNLRKWARGAIPALEQVAKNDKVAYVQQQALQALQVIKGEP